jgi:hypothetical protein
LSAWEIFPLAALVGLVSWMWIQRDGQISRLLTRELFEERTRAMMSQTTSIFSELKHVHRAQIKIEQAVVDLVKTQVLLNEHVIKLWRAWGGERSEPPGISPPLALTLANWLPPEDEDEKEKSL